jgi:hypothetical protein
MGKSYNTDEGLVITEGKLQVYYVYRRAAEERRA